MPENTTKVWELSQESGAGEVSLPDTSNLDAITRQLPQGFYTTFRTYDNGKRALGLRAHLQRLYQPASTHQIDPSVQIDELRECLAGILQAYPDDARVRLILTMGGRVYIAIEHLKPLPPQIYSRGVEVITTDVERHNPRLKSTSFISASQNARDKIAESKVFEALLVRKGYILEGMTSNFFYIKAGKLGTARNQVLLGVTRRTVLRVAQGSGLKIVYKSLKQEQIPALEEAFLTSSSRGIVPIIQIDHATVGKGHPGPITKRLIKAYNEYILGAAEKI